MRLGLIGDVHQEDELLARALEFLSGQEVDRLLCTGDVVDGPGEANSCCRLLEEADVLTVRGNHDRWLFEPQRPLYPEYTQLDELTPESRHFLRSLPELVEIETSSGLMVLCHALPGNDMTQLRPDDRGYALESNLPLLRLMAEARYRLVIGGHTHCRMVRRFGAVTVINVGTLFRQHAPCCAVMDLEQGTVCYWNVQPEGGVEGAELIKLEPGCEG
jgi:putative phosphoesterase